MNRIYTHIILHYDARLHALQAPVIEPGFEANKIINNFIYWKLKKKNDYAVVHLPCSNVTLQLYLQRLIVIKSVWS